MEKGADERCNFIPSVAQNTTQMQAAPRKARASFGRHSQPLQPRTQEAQVQKSGVTTFSISFTRQEGHGTNGRPLASG